MRKTILEGVYLADIKQINTPGEGNLQFFEEMKDIPCEIKRVYYITDVQKGVCRGGHAHKNLKQLLFCPYGEILIHLTNGEIQLDIPMNSPNVGIYIEKPIWREMFWKRECSVLCVAASDFYCEEDYIRNYKEYLSFMKENE